MHDYNTTGVCARKIRFDVEGDRLKNVTFEAGCPGNLQAIGKLVEGMTVEDVIERLKGIRCGSKQTSCADQLATALEKLKKAN